MRRVLILAVALGVPLTWVVIHPPGRPAAQGAITISVIDVAGDLSSTRVIIENYQKANPQKVKAVNFQRAPALVETTFGIIADIRRRGTTVLMVEQNAYLALRMADRAYVMETGRIVLEGPARDLLDDDHVRRAYLGA